MYYRALVSMWSCLTTPVSRRRADPPTPHLLIENGGSDGPDKGKKGMHSSLLTHGVPIATLVRAVLNDPNATVREAVLAGWVLNELEERGED
jgi:hypothetical protein